MPFVESVRVELSKPGYWVDVREFGYLDDQDLNLMLAATMPATNMEGALENLTVNQINFSGVYRAALVGGIIQWNIDDENGVLPINEQTVMLLGKDQGKVLWHILRNTSYRKMMRDLERVYEPETAAVDMDAAVFPAPSSGISPETPTAGSDTPIPAIE